MTHTDDASGETRFAHVVVGVDHSPESLQAISWARAVAATDARISLVNAWQLPVVTGYDMVVTVDPNEVEQHARKALDELVAELDDARVVATVRQGHAGRMLVAEADELGADLVVLGHRGDSRVSLMLGSTTNYVLHHTARPVVVIRGDHMGPPRRVVVGVDDHDAADLDQSPSVHALRFAYALPGVEHVHAVHAWFLPALAIGMFADVSADVGAMDGAAQATVDRVVEAAGPVPDGVELIGEPMRGTPGFALIEASRDADLVVVGSRGRGGFSGLVLGSTSTEVAAHSHAPVAIIR